MPRCGSGWPGWYNLRPDRDSLSQWLCGASGQRLWQVCVCCSTVVGLASQQFTDSLSAGRSDSGGLGRGQWRWRVRLGSVCCAALLHLAPAMDQPACLLLLLLLLSPFSRCRIPRYLLLSDAQQPTLLRSHGCQRRRRVLLSGAQLHHPPAAKTEEKRQSKGPLA